MPTNLNLHLYDGRIALNFMIFTHTLPPLPPYPIPFLSGIFLKKLSGSRRRYNAELGNYAAH